MMAAQATAQFLASSLGLESDFLRIESCLYLCPTEQLTIPRGPCFLVLEMYPFMLSSKHSILLPSSGVTRSLTMGHGSSLL